ncbi:MAG TPA: CotH kinase family protein, partial [Methanocorpusculum sp.]|nr:CotH kinase family protein [Methanocorpusculum sp.]
WDYNNAFGGFMSSSASSSVNFPIDTPVGSGVTLSDRPMVDKLLAVDEYKERYHTYMQWIAENYFNSSFGTHVDAIEALIEDYIKTDPTAFYTYDEHVAAISALKQFGELRGKSILGQLNGTIPSTWDGQNADSSNLIDASGLNMNDLGGMGGGMGGGMDFPGTMPDFGNLTIPQDMQNVGGMTMPENMQKPEDMNMPVSENMARPSDMQNAGGMNMPENMQRPEIQA